MIEYVCGLMFDSFDNPKHVLLIRKTHPEWQKGKLNAIGGKINPDEPPRNAMAREFGEECGIVTTATEWAKRLTLTGISKDLEEWMVHFYITEGNIQEARMMEDEEPIIVPLDMLFDFPLIPNLRWIIPMCLDRGFKGPMVISYFQELKSEETLKA